MMKRIDKKKIGVTASGVTVLTAGTILAVAAYQSDQNFDPSGAGDIQSNQVVFSDENDTAGSKKDNRKDKSQLLQEDAQNNEKRKAQLDAQNEYLFKNNQLIQNDMIAGIANEAADSGQQNDSGTLPGTIYDVSGNGSGADTIISGGGNANGNDSTSGNQGNHGNSGNNNGNNSGDNTNSGNNTRPSSAIKDPSIKNTPDQLLPGTIKKDYEEGVNPLPDASGDTDASIIIMQPADVTSNALYQGQELTEEAVFNSLYTYVIGSDSNVYLLGESEYGKYIRVTGVSFDGGNTWLDEYPMTIPDDVPDSRMKIKVEYRLLTKDAWKERTVDYDIRANRLYVLSEKLPENAAEIPADSVLYEEDAIEAGRTVNLFGKQYELLGENTLDKLFPGWMEDGKLVPWFYTVDSGRHILEPADCVELSDDYTVQLKHQWMSKDYEVGWQYDQLVYLQTLTGFDKKAKIGRRNGNLLDRFRYSEVQVPKYIQAVEIDDDAGLEVDYLTLPDTVIYLNNTGSGLVVNYGYDVDENNPKYQSTDEGLLLNKTGTEILGIPYEAERLVVPATVESVTLNDENKIGSIYLEAESDDQIPKLDFDNMKDCKLIVQDAILEDVALQYYKEFGTKKGNFLAAEDDEDITYTVQNGLLTSSDGKARRMLDLGYTSGRIAENVKTIQPGAFKDADEVTTVVMSNKGNEVTLEKDCFADSGIQTIYCYSKKQYESVKDQLEKSGAPEGTAVKLLRTSKEGYCYTEGAKAGEYTLVDVTDDLEEFDGMVTDEAGKPIHITEIADSAFAGCKELAWTDVPKSVQRIGYHVFEGCTSLQGVLIETEDRISIGNEAFEGCTELRYVASNAETAVMEQDYDPLISDSYGTQIEPNTYFFVKEGAEGYGANARAESVSAYRMIDVGGSNMLYGTNEAGEPIYGLRCGTTVNTRIKFPETTVSLAKYAMADTKTSNNGSYIINWVLVKSLKEIGDGCFRNAGVSGDLILKDYTVGDSAFSGCEYITSAQVQGEKVSLGQYLFRNCSNLKSVVLDVEIDHLDKGMFDGCNNLTDLYLNKNVTPPMLTIYYGVGFQFNGEWTTDEESEKLSIHVPEGCEGAYLKKWRYAFTGYCATSDVWSGETTAYQNLWSGVQWNLYEANWRLPDDEEVDEEVNIRLTDAENRIRGLLGMGTVADATDFYPYHTSSGILTLVGASPESTDIALTPELLEFPEGWYLDYVGTGAFRKCKNLHSVTMEGNLVGVESNAFKGVEGDLTLNFEGPFAPILVLDEAGTPFEFGVADENLHINVPEGFETIYIEDWIYPLCGYEDLWSMFNAYCTSTEEDEFNQQLEEMNRVLDEARNRLRRMMGLPEISISEEETSADNITPIADGKEETSADNATPAADDKEEKESGADDETDGTGEETKE